MQTISWDSAAERISTLMEQGLFATNVELDEAAGFERQQIAQSLWYLRQGFSQDCIDQGFLSTLQSVRGGRVSR